MLIRNLFIILLFTIGVCNAQGKTLAVLKSYRWVGFINKKIPVELTYTISKDIISGEIRYLNTKGKTPVKIIGNVSSNEGYTLCEFEKDGNISGIINVKLNGQKLEGEWSSTKSDGSYPISLTLKDNKVKQEVFPPASITGKYEYHYGEKGYEGLITIKKQKGNTYTYEIGSVTSDPARNMADASGDAILLNNNQFIIEINKSCKFKVTFYNGFLTITANDKTQLMDCEFGFNATLEGTYLKIKD